MKRHMKKINTPTEKISHFAVGRIFYTAPAPSALGKRSGCNFTVTRFGFLYILAAVMCLGTYWLEGERPNQRTNTCKED